MGKEPTMVTSRAVVPVGERFGYLIVLGEGAPHYSSRRASRGRKAALRVERTWVVQCDCGNEATILAGNIRGGRTITCGTHGHGRSSSPLVPRTYASVHVRLTRERGRASEHTCIECGGGAADWAYNNSCPEEVQSWVKHDHCVLRYCEHLEHYDPMCRSHHQIKDAAENKKRDNA